MFGNFKIFMNYVKMFFICFGICFGETLLASDQLIVYPEYPSGIAKNTDYTVTVQQGTTTELVYVYNSLRQTVGYGDNYRRFCEFAFSGSSVTVNITVNAWTINSYEIIPSQYGLSSSVQGNVISVTLKNRESS